MSKQLNDEKKLINTNGAYYMKYWAYYQNYSYVQALGDVRWHLQIL